MYLNEMEDAGRLNKNNALKKSLSLLNLNGDAL